MQILSAFKPPYHAPHRPIALPHLHYLPPSFAHPIYSVLRPSCAFAYVARDAVWSASVDADDAAAGHDGNADAGADVGVCACGMDADTSCRPVRALRSR